MTITLKELALAIVIGCVIAMIWTLTLIAIRDDGTTIPMERIDRIEYVPDTTIDPAIAQNTADYEAEMQQCRAEQLDCYTYDYSSNLPSLREILAE